MKATYIFYLPAPTKRSAGISYLHGLISDLRELGFEAYWTNDFHLAILESDVRPSYWIPFYGALHMVRFGKVVAVYPEVVTGNPLGCLKVVRLICNFPGLLGGDTDYSPSEKVYLYSKFITAGYKGKVDGFLYKPMIDTSLFHRYNFVDRSKKLFYVGKGVFKEGYTDDSFIEVTRTNPPRSQLPELFNESSEIIVFDNQTSLIQEAALCGCIPVVIPDSSLTLEAFSLYELGRIGVAVGVEDKQRAIESLPQLPVLIDKYIQLYGKQLNQFIEDTQWKWPSRAVYPPDENLYLLESLAYEVMLLRNFRAAVYAKIKEGRALFTLDDVPSNLQTNRLPRVMIWGVGEGAKAAMPFLLRHFYVMGFISSSTTPKWLFDFEKPVFKPEELDVASMPLDAIIVASSFKREIKAVASSLVLGKIPLLYLPSVLLKSEAVSNQR